jgi:hypothetical protein
VGSFFAPVKSTWFSRKPHHDFARCLKEADSSHSPWRSFSDWVALAYLSLSQAAHKVRTGTMDEAKETEYLELIRHYKNPSKMAEALAIVVDALEEECYDFIGSAAAELELLNHWHGQFFTPKTVCELMCRMTLESSEPNPDRRLTISDPACGAGAMAIASAEILKEKGFMPWHFWIDCKDIDRRMFQACYIQLTLCGIPGVVRWGDTIRNSQHLAEPTLVGVIHPFRYSAVERAEMEASKKAQEEAAEAARIAANTLTLSATFTPASRPRTPRPNRGVVQPAPAVRPPPTDHPSLSLFD